MLTGNRCIRFQMLMKHIMNLVSGIWNVSGADIVHSGFEKFFPIIKLSRNKAKDKKWTTEALRKSTKTKNKVYKIG